jgi:hypothetical protein
MDILGVELEKVPEEVKNSMLRVVEARKRSAHAIRQSSLWNEERLVANKVFDAAQQDWALILQRWNPATNEMIPLQDQKD